MNEVILWIILLVAAVTAILVVVLLIRGTKVSEGVGREVRDELRTSREEARNAGRELREEVSNGLKSTNEVLAKTMEGLGKLQQTQLEGMTKQLTELINSNQAALDRVRLTFDSRVKELQDRPQCRLIAVFAQLRWDPG